MFKLEKLKDKAVLTIYGYVGGYYMDFRAVNSAIAAISAAGYTKMDFRLHTYGGTVFDGNLIYNFIASFNGEVDIYIDGVAASMGAVLIMAGTRVHIAENGFVMIHAPKGGGEGNAKDFIQYAKLLRGMEKNFVTKLMQRTGKPEAEVTKWMDGTDYWFDADEAISLGLVDDKFAAKVILPTTLEKTEAAQMGAKAVYDSFVALTTEIEIPKNEMNKKDLIARYGLVGVTEASTDEEILAAIDAKMKAGNDADERAKAAAKAAIETVVDAAVTAGKIPAAKRDEYVARGEKIGMDELKAIVADMQVYKPLAGQLSGGGAGEAAGRENWKWADYQAKAAADLEAMPKKDPEKFKALYKEEFGAEPEV